MRLCYQFRSVSYLLGEIGISNHILVFVWQFMLTFMGVVMACFKTSCCCISSPKYEYFSINLQN